MAITLIEHCADLSCKKSKGLSLLHSAIIKEDVFNANFIIEQLQNSNVTYNSLLFEAVSDNGPLELQGCNSLHLLARHYSPEMLSLAKKILKAGIDPNSQNKKGDTALHCCIMERNLSMIELIINESEDINLEIRNNNKKTPLEIALRLDGEPGLISKILLIAGVELNPSFSKTEGNVCIMYSNVRNLSKVYFDLTKEKIF